MSDRKCDQPCWCSTTSLHVRAEFNSLTRKIFDVRDWKIISDIIWKENRNAE